MSTSTGASQSMSTSTGSTPRAYEQVVGWIEDRILCGAFEVGDVLPAERDLAAQLGVSRAAVREGVRSLQAQGVLRSSVGAGGTGGTRVAALSSGALTRLMRIHVALMHYPLEDVIEVRVALERLSVRLAAQGVTLEQLDGLQARVEDMDGSQSRLDFNDADAAFHVAIAEAAGNRLAAETTIAIRESVRAPLMTSLSRLDDDVFARIRAEFNAEHRAVLEAISIGEAERAETLMETHIRTAWTRLQSAVAADPERQGEQEARHTSGAAEPGGAAAVTMGA